MSLEPTQSSQPYSREQLAQWAFFLVTIVGLFFSSFFFIPLWIDENISAWIISAPDLMQVGSRAWEFQGQSPLYYWLLWLWSALFGQSETAFRSFSLACLIGSGVLVFKLIHTHLNLPRSAALIGVLVLLSSQRFVWMISARPYALGFFFCVLSAYFVLCYMRDGQRTHFWGAIVSTALILYSHSFFLGFLGAHYLLVLWHQKYTWTKLGLKIAQIHLVALFLFIPGIFQLWHLSGRTEVLQFDPMPHVSEMLLSIGGAYVPRSLFVAFFITIVFVAFVLKGTSIGPSRVGRSTWFSLLLWLVLPPLGLYLLCLLFDLSIFKSRYYVWNTIALSFAYAAFVASFREEKGRTVALMILCATLLFEQSGRGWRDEGWASALATVQGIQNKSEIPLVLQPGLVESRELNWIKDEHKREYLKSPIAYYAPSANPILLPRFLLTDAEKDFAREHLPPSTFLLLAYKPSQSLFKFIAEQGYARIHEYQVDQEVQLVRFEKVAAKQVIAVE
jgi:hypothetical protein